MVTTATNKKVTSKNKSANGVAGHAVPTTDVGGPVMSFAQPNVAPAGTTAPSAAIREISIVEMFATLDEQRKNLISEVNKKIAWHESELASLKKLVGPQVASALAAPLNAILDRTEEMEATRAAKKAAAKSAKKPAKKGRAAEAGSFTGQVHEAIGVRPLGMAELRAEFPDAKPEQIAGSIQQLLGSKRARKFGRRGHYKYGAK